MSDETSLTWYVPTSEQRGLASFPDDHEQSRCSGTGPTWA
jgi:hypothetical protein